MSADTTDNQRKLMSLQAGEVRVYAPPSWLTRRFIILALIGMFTVGPVPTAFMVTAVDQWLRNKVNDLMRGPDLYKSLSLEPKEFLRLPLHWRQALAELSVRPATAKLAEIRELMKTLTSEQIKLISRIAPYVVEGLLVRDRDSPSKHPIPGLSIVDFAMLEDLRILQNIQRGYKYNAPPNRPIVMRGRTAAIKIQGLDQESVASLPVTRLTELGNTLIGLLRVPSDIRYFEWIAKEIDQEGIDVSVWATGARIKSAGRIQRNTVASWP